MAFRKVRSEEGGSEMAPANTGNALSAFIDQGSEFEGKLTFKDTVRIDGTFRGEISSENTLIVGESGQIEASVRSRNVILSGRVVGDVFASNQLVIHKNGRLEGDVETGSLVLEEGALLNGRVTMKPSTAPAASAFPPPRSDSAQESDDDA